MRADDLAIWSGSNSPLAGPLGRLGTLEVRLAGGMQCPGPRLERHRLEGDVVRQMARRVRAVHALRVDRQLHDARGRPDSRVARRRSERTESQTRGPASSAAVNGPIAQMRATILQNPAMI